MEFEKLEIENFSSYYGKHSIDLKTSSDKPVVIIVGGSGEGKTSIFDALNWALYGRAYESVLLQQRRKRIGDYVNETALKESKDGVEMACSLYFSHEGNSYRVQQAVFAKQFEDKVEITDETYTLYEHEPSGNLSEVKYVESFLNEVLPNNVRDYFLFDGDRISELAQPGSSEEIRDGIYRVVDLELLQNGTKSLQEAAKKLRRQTRSVSSGESADIQEKLLQAYDLQETLKQKKTNIQEEMRSLDDLIEKADAKLGSLEETIALQNKKSILEINKKRNEEIFDETIGKLRSKTAIASISFVLNDINILKKVLDEKRQKGEIPSSISENLLRDILEVRKCICGTEFQEGDIVFKELTQRLDKELGKQKEGQNLLEFYFELDALSTEVKRSHRDLFSIEEKRRGIEARGMEIHKNLEAISKTLENHPKENVSELASLSNKYHADVERLKWELRDVSAKIDDKSQLILRLNEEREQVQQKLEVVRKAQLKDDLAQRAAQELEIIFEKFAEDSRKEVEELTRMEFKKFIPTAESLSVGINSEFHYDVKDQNGNSALQQLSNGQKQALSLAYITSIARVSEKNPPLVIDMPFGRLDEGVQDNIAKRLPEIASQIVLLVLPGSEWNEHTQAILDKKASHTYYLEFDKQNRQSSIVKKDN